MREKKLAKDTVDKIIEKIAQSRRKESVTLEKFRSDNDLCGQH